MRRLLGAAVAALVIAGAVVSVAEAEDPGQGSGATAAGAVPFHYRPCPEDVTMKSLRCARMRMPLERSDPSMGTIPIAFAVRPPSDRSKPAKGTIFAQEGGPGYGSIASAPYYAAMLGKGLLERYRLVTVDMRGTGHSQAIDCKGLQKANVSDSVGVERCAKQLGPDFAAYRTSAGVDDLDAVRAALGIDKITLYGDSYGTFFSQSYAYRHGDHLNAVIIDSAYPVRSESPWYPSLTRKGVKSLQIVCRRTAGCQPGARKRLDRVVVDLRRTDRGAGPLLDALGSAGYTPAPPSYRAINEAVSDYLEGRSQPLKRATKPHGGTYGSPRAYSRGQELAVSCNDYPMLWNKASSFHDRHEQLMAAVRDHDPDAFLPFTPHEVALESFSSYRECRHWPRPTPLYEPPAPPGAEAPDVPTLVLSGELDNVTSAYEAQKVADAFPDARRVVIRNAGHVPSLYGGRFPGAEGRVREFVRRFSG
jgi:pimeloyl-ACP methyl ester carboxylesterase